MNKFLKYTAIAALLAAPAAYADTPTTKGGLTIKSDDGRFEATVGGRIHFDGVMLNADDSQTANNENSGFYFRRVFITLKGKAYGWSYQIDEDISNVSSKAPAQTARSTSVRKNHGAAWMKSPATTTPCSWNATRFPLTVSSAAATS